jgi:hypothetical protein
MRRLPLFCLLLLALAVPAMAFPANVAEDDGTLVVKGAAGVVSVTAEGGVIGRIAQYGTVRLTDIDATDGSGLPRVWSPEGCDNLVKNLSDTTLNPDDKVIVCRGTDVRFRLIGGSFRVLVTGEGINLSVVGQGTWKLTGDPDAISTGTYAVNNGKERPLPLDPIRGELDAAATIE